MAISEVPQGVRMRPESESLHQEDTGGQIGYGDSTSGSLKWEAVRPEENEPRYIKNIFGTIIYNISKIISLEKKEYQRRISHGN